MDETRARIDWPTVMIIAFGEDETKLFSRVLDAQMFKVVRATSVAAANEQLLSAMPHVVVVAQTAFGVGDDAAFAERTTAIGAEVVVLPESADPNSVTKLLCSAVDRVLARRTG